MRKSKWIKILASIGVIILIVFVVIPPFTRKWYRNHLLKYAPPAPTSKWQKFSSTEGKFSIWFPGTPAETNEFVTNSNMAAEEHIFNVNADIQDGYTVAYCDSDKFDEFMKNGKAQEFLEKSESIVVAEANGEILTQQETTFGNYPSREFEYKAGGKANYSVKVKYVMVGQRVYSLMAVYMTGNPYPQDRATFFKSFQLQN
jgi:hypothetical protein